MSHFKNVLWQHCMNLDPEIQDPKRITQLQVISVSLIQLLDRYSLPQFRPIMSQVSVSNLDEVLQDLITCLAYLPTLPLGFSSSPLASPSPSQT